MEGVAHLGSRLAVLFVEQDEAGNALREIPVTLLARTLTPEAYLELFRQAWEQRNEVRKGMNLLPLPLPESYLAAVAAMQAQAMPVNGHTAEVKG